jgi:hypothetical protein
MKLIVVWILLLSTVAPISGNQSAPVDDEKTTPTEEQEVRRFAKQFSAATEKTRDLTPYLTKPPASTVLRKVITDRDDPIGFVESGVASSVGEYRVVRFYAAMWNVACLRESYIYGKFPLKETAIRDLPPSLQYPPNVVRFMKHNPTLSDWWNKSDSSDSQQIVKSVAQFNSLVAAYNRVAVLMRQYLSSHPPERTVVYKQNQIFLKPSLKEIFAKRCDNEKECAGLPLNTRIIWVHTSVLLLLLVRLNGRLQIAEIDVHGD